MTLCPYSNLLAYTLKLHSKTRPENLPGTVVFSYRQGKCGLNPWWISPQAWECLPTRQSVALRCPLLPQILDLLIFLLWYSLLCLTGSSIWVLRNWKKWLEKACFNSESSNPLLYNLALLNETRSLLVKVWIVLSMDRGIQVSAFFYCTLTFINKIYWIPLIKIYWALDESTMMLYTFYTLSLLGNTFLLRPSALKEKHGPKKWDSVKWVPWFWAVQIYTLGPKPEMQLYGPGYLNHSNTVH